MKKLCIGLLGLSVMLPVSADTVVDVYGTDARESTKIIKKYGPPLVKIWEGLIVLLPKSDPTKKDQIQMEKLIKEKRKIEAAIKKEGHFLFIDIAPVIYPDLKTNYITIDVVRADEPQRLQILPPDSKKTVQKAHNSGDLIDTMIAFDEKEMILMVNNKLDLKNPDCPVYHCFSGFAHPELKPYLAIFNTGAIKQKALIINTLNNDPDSERRAAAVFLMGHFKDPKEIVTLLTPHLKDPDSGVRNNVMRVMFFTMIKSKPYEVALEPLIQLLDSPYETDRNKSLLILTVLADSDNAKKRIKNEAGQNILKLLALKQPNNHHQAHELLKKISGKSFAEYDMKSWSNWVATA